MLAFLQVHQVIFVAFDPGIDRQVQGGQKAVGAVLQPDLHSFGVMLVIKQGDLLSDQGRRGLIELAIQGNGAVGGHSSSGSFAEVILQVIGGRPDALHFFGKAPHGRLAYAAVFALVIDIGYPEFHGLVDLIQGFAHKSGQKLHPDRAEKSFDLSPPLGLVGFGVDQGDAQRGAYLLKMARSDGRAVVHVEFSGQPPFQKGLPQSVQVAVQPFGGCKTRHGE